MNGFYGLFKTDKISGEDDAFLQMTTNLNERNFNTGKALCDDQFLCNHFSKGASFAEQEDQALAQSEDANLMLAGYFRLDYRDELGDKLGIPQEMLTRTGDAMLVKKAYLKWEKNCVLHLEGDWAFVLFDKLRNKVLMAKDSSGCSALFYRQGGGCMYFASDATVLMNVAGLPAEVDTTQLLRISLPFVRMEAGKTLVKELFYLREASAMIYTGAEWSSPFRYLCVTEPAKSHFHFDEDAAFAHFSCLQQAVRQRILSASLKGVMLSSGMDSMAVASLASRELELFEERLHTYTSFPHHREALSQEEKAYADESEIVRRFASLRENVDASFGDFGEFRLSQCDEKSYLHGPFQPIIHLNDFWINGLLEKASGQGVGLMMTGQMGNFTISGDGYFVHADLFRNGAIPHLYKELLALSNRTGKSMWTVFRNRVLAVFWYQVKSLYHFQRLYGKSYWEKFPYLQSAFVKAFSGQLQKSRFEHIGGHYWVRSGVSLRKDLMARHLCYAGMLWYGYGLSHGVKVSDPTADRRLISHTFEIGDGFFFRNGQSKWIYQTMMKGIVDQEVQENRAGKIQSHDFGLRMAADELLGDKLDSFELDERLQVFFNHGPLKKMLREIVNSPKPQMKKTRIFQFLQCFSVINYVFSQKELILNLKSQSNVHRK